MNRRTVISGGPILTMGADMRAEAVAVLDERILHVGSLEECRDAAGQGSVEFDLGGRTLLPGFVDAHTHPLMLGQCAAWVDGAPPEVTTIDALVEMLVGRARRGDGGPTTGLRPVLALTAVAAVLLTFLTVAAFALPGSDLVQALVGGNPERGGAPEWSVTQLAERCSELCGKPSQRQAVCATLRATLEPKGLVKCTKEGLRQVLWSPTDLARPRSLSLV
jgi:hypothetical protein